MFQAGGFDEAEQVCQDLDKLGLVDFVELSGGNYETADTGFNRTATPSTSAREAFFIEIAQKVKQVMRRSAVMLTGGFRTSAAMNDALKRGLIDLVGIGRPFVSESMSTFAALVRGERVEKPLDAPAVLIVPRNHFLRNLNNGLEAIWYGIQMQRIGDGKGYDPNLPVWTCFPVIVPKYFVNFRRLLGPKWMFIVFPVLIFVIVLLRRFVRMF